MRTILLLFLLLLTTCSAPEKEAIRKRLETVDGIRYDLKTKILSMQELPPVTGADSAQIITAWLDSLERVVDRNYEVSLDMGWEYDREHYRRKIIPALLLEHLTRYQAGPDSVLILPYRVKVRQTVNGTDREFERVVYLSPNK